MEHQKFCELDGSSAQRALCAFQVGSFLVFSRRRSAKTLIVTSSNFSSNSVGKSLVTLGGGEFGWHGDGGAEWEVWLWERMPLVSLHPDIHDPLTAHFCSKPPLYYRCASLHLCKKDFFFLGLGKAWY